MHRVEPTRRYSISKGQLDILLYLLKYRFLTSDILAELIKKDRSTIYERLSVLVDQGYIAKQYDSTFRLRRRPATYCLAPAGIRYLKHQGIERTQLHYKNKNFTEEQIDEQLLYTKLSRAVRRSYPDTFSTYTKYQLEYGAYALPMPHIVLKANSDKTPDYLIEVFPAFTASWKLRRRIN
jgi:predicted transcriptional regulator